MNLDLAVIVNLLARPFYAKLLLQLPCSLSKIRYVSLNQGTVNTPTAIRPEAARSGTLRAIRN